MKMQFLFNNFGDVKFTAQQMQIFLSVQGEVRIINPKK